MKLSQTTFTFLILSSFSSVSAQTTVISPTLNNGGFESEQLDGNTGTRTGNTSGDGFGDRFAVNNGTITVDGWFIETSGFGGLDASQINDFTDPPPANGQDQSPNKGREESRRVILVNNAVEVSLTSESVGAGFSGDDFTLSFWTAGNRTDNNHFTVAASLIFDEGLLSEAILPFTVITHTELDAANGTLTDNTTTGFIFRDELTLGTVTAPAAYTTAQLEIIIDNNGTDGANENDQIYLDDVTLTLDQPTLDPNGDEDMDNLTNSEESSGSLNPYNSSGTLVGVGNGGAPTDPLIDDSDGDGIKDGDEVSASLGGGVATNPNAKDTDGDTIEDGDEVNASQGSANITDPTDPDSDGDELPDNWENDNGLNPNSGAGLDGADGDREPDGFDNIEEFEEGTDPNLADTDGDGVNDGVEFNDDGTNPLDPDEDHDTLNDGAEKEAGSDPLEKDTDGDDFSDALEVNIFGTDPDDFNDIPSVSVLIDISNGNGSFEDTNGATNPSNSGNGTSRFAANGADQVATLPGWSATWLNGFVGFDSSAGADDGFFYGFVNANSAADFQSDAVTHAISPGEVFHIQMNTTNNAAGGSSSYTVSLVFDGGAPVEVGTFDHAETEVNDYYERYLTYQTTTAASDVAILINSDNTTPALDQPRFDLVRLYAEPGVLPATLEITDIAIADGTVTITFSGEASTEYVLKSGTDLASFDTTVTPTGGSMITDTNGDGSVEFNFVPDELFVRLEEMTLAN